MITETCIAPVNIAVIKYWGKRDEVLILPINDSISMTLSTDQMCAKTTAAASSDFKENKMWLNSEEVPFENNPRISRCLEALKTIAERKNDRKFPLEWKIHVCSENNFPTAAGLASSAAGYACLVYTLACLYGIQENNLSSIARLGSGSACRSMYGGFVQWIKGNLSDGTDSVSVQIESPIHWPEMHVLILVVNDARKKTSSTKGMLDSIKTSELLKYRAEKCVPERVELMKNAIHKKDFAKFAELTIKESNQFHAVCLDTYPPCVYMNDISHAIVEFVHQYNDVRGDMKVAYTFDAGPNACLYLEENEVLNVLSALSHAFPNDKSTEEYVKGIPVNIGSDSQVLKKSISDRLIENNRNLLHYIIHTKIGDGPQRLSINNSLLNDAGLPKNIK